LRFNTDCVFRSRFFHILGIFIPDEICFCEILTDRIALTASENRNFLGLDFVCSFCQNSNLRLNSGRWSNFILRIFAKAIFYDLESIRQQSIFIVRIEFIRKVLDFRYGVEIRFESAQIRFCNQTSVVANIFGYLGLYLLDQIKFIFLGQVIKENQLIVFVSLTKFWHWIEVY